jgi:hypothetical protein
MMTDGELPVAQRIVQLFQHLGISQAHVASRMPQDWMVYPENMNRFEKTAGIGRTLSAGGSRSV